MDALGPFVDAGAKDSEVLVLIVDYRGSLPYQSAGIDRFYHLRAVYILLLRQFCWRIDVA